MSEENPPRPIPRTDDGSLVNPQPSADRKSTPRIYLSPRIRKSALVLAATVVVLGGFFLWRYLSSYESTDDAQADVPLYPVSARISELRGAG